MKYIFILENKETYSVEKMCLCMAVSKNAFYTWKKSHKKGSTISKTVLLKQRVREVFFESKEIYGGCRIKKQLERGKIYYGRAYIAHLMKGMGLRSILKKEICNNNKFKPFSFSCKQYTGQRFFFRNIRGEMGP